MARTLQDRIKRRQIAPPMDPPGPFPEVAGLSRQDAAISVPLPISPSEGDLATVAPAEPRPPGDMRPVGPRENSDARPPAALNEPAGGAFLANALTPEPLRWRAKGKGAPAALGNLADQAFDTRLRDLVPQPDTETEPPGARTDPGALKMVFGGHIDFPDYA
jgi:hypothetical protein